MVCKSWARQSELSWHFGGHIDLAATPGWSNQIARVYLQSLLEFTHPEFTTDAVFSPADGTRAGDGGLWKMDALLESRRRVGACAWLGDRIYSLMWVFWARVPALTGIFQREQIQYSDMCIPMSIPFFTWVKVPIHGNAPPARVLCLV